MSPNLDFSTLQENIKLALSRGVREKSITPKQLLFILEILGRMNDGQSLKFWLEILADDFLVLADLVVADKKALRSDFEQIVREFVAGLLPKDPLKAAEISKTALQKGVTAEQLAQIYPEFKTFLEQHQL